mgnify:CR=1 FL=1|jgi:hypothetical protein|tara:strand:- start:269 stop:802 length:534 start_codon:yes stop_codon:yes gene_type:complete
MPAAEPNIEGAIQVVVEILVGNGFAKTRAPYEPNFRGLVDSLIDLKEGFPSFSPLQVGFNATAFEAISENDALFMRTADGQVGKAIASDGASELAQVIGLANADTGAGDTAKVIVTGIKNMTGASLDAGDTFFLSASTAGAITTTAPSGTNNAITKVGEAASATEFSIGIDYPIKLD